MPSAAGTGFQSQSGSADHAFPLAGRLVAGRAFGSRVNVALVVADGDLPRDPCRPKWSVSIAPAGGQLEKFAAYVDWMAPGPGRSGAAVEEHPDPGCLPGERRPGGGQAARAGEPDRRKRGHRRDAGGEAGELAEELVGQCPRVGRDLAGHVDVEELEPAGDGLGICRVDVPPVDHVGEQRRGPRNGVDQRRPLRAGLFVLERSGQEDRDGDVTRPPRPWTGDRRGTAPGRARCPAPPAAARPGRPGSPTGCAGPGWPGTRTNDRGRPTTPRRSRSRSRAGPRWPPGRSPVGPAGRRGRRPRPWRRRSADGPSWPRSRRCRCRPGSRSRRGRRSGSWGRWRPARADRCPPRGTGRGPSS